MGMVDERDVEVGGADEVGEMGLWIGGVGEGEILGLRGVNVCGFLRDRWVRGFRPPLPGSATADPERPPPKGEGGRGAGGAEDGVAEFADGVDGGDLGAGVGGGVDDAADVVEGGVERLGEVGVAVVAADGGEVREPGLDVGLEAPLEGLCGLDAEVFREVHEVGVDVGEEVEAVAVFGGERGERLRIVDCGLRIGRARGRLSWDGALGRAARGARVQCDAR
jgi:hypothetical protein